MDAFLSHFVKYIGPNWKGVLISLRIMLTHWFNLHTSALQKDFIIFFAKFLRPFVSGTDGVNCLTTKSQPFSKNQARQELPCCAFIPHTGGLHHKTVGCNKIDSGINYRAVLRLGWEYLVLFIGPFIAVLLFSLRAKHAGFVHLWTHSPIAWKSETGHFFFLLGRNKVREDWLQLSCMIRWWAGRLFYLNNWLKNWWIWCFNRSYY